MKKFSYLLLPLLFIFADWVASYDNIVTHPKYSQEAINLFQKETGQNLSLERQNLIVQGSIKEDVLPRPLNHFYDPSTGLGLDSQHISAKDWALRGGWSGLTGDYSEKAILDNYNSGDMERAYEGVGHILHLIQDMAVPAHVRNDSHADGDPYENWAQAKGQLNGFSFVYSRVYGLDQAFIDLASYTHNNFLSKDNNINIFDLTKGDVKDISVLGQKDKYFVIDGFAKAIVDDSGLAPKFYYKDNSKLNQDYWNQLAPKAVGYSAGIIGYFQNKFAEIDRNKDLQKSESSFLGTAKDMLAMIWSNNNYLASDVLSSLDVKRQEVWRTTTELASQAIETTKLASEITHKSADAVMQKTTNTINKTLKKTKVLGEKIIVAMPHSPEPKLAVISVGKSTVDTHATLNSPSRDIGNKIVINLLPPAHAATPDNPNLAAPIRTTPLPTFGAPPLVLSTPFSEPLNKSASEPISQPVIEPVSKPANTVPIVLPDPIIYPRTQILSQPLALSSSSLAKFTFASDQASSTFEYVLGQISSTSVWLPASSTLALANLSDGQYAIHVRAVYKKYPDATPADYIWTIDTTAPSSQLSTLNQYYNQKTFPMAWSRTDGGKDDIFYSLDYAIDGGPWQLMIVASTATNTLFMQGVNPGDNVGFRISACDQTGNCEATSSTAQVGTRVGPVYPATATLALTGASGNSAGLTWNTPTDANLQLATSAKYELKYQIKSGSCTLVANWETASISSGLPTPQTSSTTTEKHTLNNLSANSTYCVAIKTFNGVNWSNVSNILEFKTGCADTAPRAANYTTHLTKASTSSVPNQTPESILVVDYTDYFYYYTAYNTPNVDFGVYDLFGGKSCGPIAPGNAFVFFDNTANLARIELAYDPVTKLFTGYYRQCENGYRYLAKPEGDHCQDFSNAWFGRRWIYSQQLAGQSNVALQRTITGQFTEWLKP